MSEFGEDEDHPEVLDYQSLASGESPALKFEEKVIAALRTQRLIRKEKANTRPFRYWKTLAAVAASVILFFAGIFLEKYRSGPANQNFVSMTEKTFLLLLVEDHRYQPARNEQEQQERINLYRNWAVTLRQKGLTLNGTKLQQQTYFLPSDTAQKPHHSEVAGYFLIDAGDLNQAMQIAGTCPHLRFGGQIEVRQIDPV
jgi:hypothetical protein